MKDILLVYANDLVIAHKWYTALLGIQPLNEKNGVRYVIGKTSLLLGTTGIRAPLALLISSINDARKRLEQAGLDAREVLGMAHNYEDGETASFQDPSGNLVMLTDISKSSGSRNKREKRTPN